MAMETTPELHYHIRDTLYLEPCNYVLNPFQYFLMT